MIGTTTMTQTGLRIELVSLEMQSLNDRSLKDSNLNEIIDYCAPRGFLESFTIWGMEDGKAHLRLRVELDYEEHERQIRLHGDALPDGMTGQYSITYGPPGGELEGFPQPPSCPHMGKALDLFIKLARDKGLRLHWTVCFREKRTEMCAKFGLERALIDDCSSGCAPSMVTNSRYPELTMTGRVSEAIVPPG